MQHVIRDPRLEFGSPVRGNAVATTSAPLTNFERFRKDAYDRLFINKHGKDMRLLPMVCHPQTGALCFDHGFWPIG